MGMNICYVVQPIMTANRITVVQVENDMQYCSDITSQQSGFLEFERLVQKDYYDLVADKATNRVTIDNCRDAAWQLNDILLRYGYKVRTVCLLLTDVESTECHYVIEVWIDGFNKWVLVDPAFHSYYFDKCIPMSVYELQLALIENRRIIFLGNAIIGYTQRLQYLKMHCRSCMRLSIMSYKKDMDSPGTKALIWTESELTSTQKTRLITSFGPTQWEFVFFHGNLQKYWEI